MQQIQIHCVIRKSTFIKCIVVLALTLTSTLSLQLYQIRILIWVRFVVPT